MAPARSVLDRRRDPNRGIAWLLNAYAVHIGCLALIGCSGPQISGQVVDADTKAPIANAMVTIANSSHRTSTDSAGAFSLPLIDGLVTVRAEARKYQGQAASQLVVSKERYPDGVKLPPLELLPNVYANRQTGRLWVRKSSTDPPVRAATREEAATYCESLIVDDLKGWRLPTGTELSVLWSDATLNRNKHITISARPNRFAWSSDEVEGGKVRLVNISPFEVCDFEPNHDGTAEACNLEVDPPVPEGALISPQRLKVPGGLAPEVVCTRLRQ